MCVYGIFIRWIRNNIYGLWSEVEQQGPKNMDEFSPNVTSCKSKRINCAFSCHPILLLCRLSYMLCSAVCGRYGGRGWSRGLSSMIMNSLRKCKLPSLSCEFACPFAVCSLISSLHLQYYICMCMRFCICI